MIELTKTPQPQVLIDNADTWTREYLTAHAAGRIPAGVRDRYRHQEIKRALERETHEKCAYCEAKISQVYPGDVEHILPKTARPELILDWNNLTYACFKCNNKKRGYYNPANALINPYVDNPTDFLEAHGPCIFHKIGNTRAETTERHLNLNRTPLLERRKEKIQSMNDLIERWSSETDPSFKSELQDQILEEAGTDKEFSFVLRSYVRNRCGF